jgi:hypothetical protein
VRRLVGIFIKLATVLSLILCIGAAILWVRSHWIVELWTYQGGPSGVVCEIHLLGDGLHLDKSRWKEKSLEPKRWEHLRLHRDLALDEVEDGYFDAWSLPDLSTTFVPIRPGSSDGWLLSIRLPYWVMVVALAILPGVWMWGRLKRRRVGRAGRCAVSGCELCATTGRCPECDAGTTQSEPHVEQ